MRPGTPPRPPPPEGGPGGAVFWVAATLGLAIVGFGLAGLTRNVQGPQLTSWGTWVLGSLLAHDALLAPLTALLGALAARWAPPSIRSPMQAGFLISAALALIAIPVVGGWGGNPGNPTLLPDGDYWPNLLIALAAVWAVVIAVALASRRRRRA